MYQMLKQKQAKGYIFLLKKEDGTTASNETENLWPMNILGKFSSSPKDASKERVEAQREIKLARH